MDTSQTPTSLCPPLCPRPCSQRAAPPASLPPVPQLSRGQHTGGSGRAQGVRSTPGCARIGPSPRAAPRSHRGAAGAQPPAHRRAPPHSDLRWYREPARPPRPGHPPPGAREPRRAPVAPVPVPGERPVRGRAKGTPARGPRRAPTAVGDVPGQAAAETGAGRSLPGRAGSVPGSPTAGPSSEASRDRAARAHRGAVPARRAPGRAPSPVRATLGAPQSAAGAPGAGPVQRSQARYRTAAGRAEPNRAVRPGRDERRKAQAPHRAQPRLRCPSRCR